MIAEEFFLKAISRSKWCYVFRLEQENEIVHWLRLKKKKKKKTNKKKKKKKKNKKKRKKQKKKRIRKGCTPEK